ncbi:MAG: MATE family efflux transporter [Bradyrhizobium sp.]
MSHQTATTTTPFPAPAKPASARAAARTKLILEGPIFSTLLRMSAPNVLNLLAFTGMVTFDGFFLGRLGSDALAGASLVFPWVMLVLQSTNSGMGAGVSSAVARAVGAGKSERANALVFHAFLLALALGAIFAGLMLLGGLVLFRLMGGQDDMLDAALAYAYVRWAAPPRSACSTSWAMRCAVPATWRCRPACWSPACWRTLRSRRS